jgi:ribonuclease HII
LDQSLKKVASRANQNLSRFTPEGPYATQNSQDSSLLNIYLDGGLKAPSEYKNQKTVIKGDELHPVISCASIVAKVSRDRLMDDYTKEYPEYGFENHAGYGTKAHYDAIKKHGVTVLHRKSFLKGK